MPTNCCERGNEEDLCTFVYTDGRKCRAGKVPTRSVCLHHWRHDGQFFDDSAATNELLQQAAALKSRADVRAFLAAVIRFTVQGRLPHRKAALLTYQAQLLLFGQDKQPHWTDKQIRETAASLKAWIYGPDPSAGRDTLRPASASSAKPNGKPNGRSL